MVMKCVLDWLVNGGERVHQEDSIQKLKRIASWIDSWRQMECHNIVQCKVVQILALVNKRVEIKKVRKDQFKGSF